MKYDIFNIRNTINYVCFRRMTSDKATDSRVDKHPKRKVHIKSSFDIQDIIGIFVTYIEIIDIFETFPE